MTKVLVVEDDPLNNIGLPGIDGIEALRIIKTSPKYKDVPAVALTSYAMKGDRERFLEAGFDDYIAKPIDVPDFMKRLEKYKKYETLFKIIRNCGIRIHGRILC